MVRKIPALVMLAILLAASAAAHACSCAAPATAVDAMDNATAVFSGEVTKIERYWADRLGLTKRGNHEVTFRVLQAWKGVTARTVTLQTRLTGEACGYPFVAGGAYLVFVRETAPGLETGICTGTRELAGAEAEIRALDAVPR